MRSALFFVLLCANLSCMVFAPRTLRQDWYRDIDGVLTRPVSADDVAQEILDLSDDFPGYPPLTLSWLNTFGVVLSALSESAGIVTFQRTGFGEATLVVSYADILAALVAQADAIGVAALYDHLHVNGTGSGAVAGAAVGLYIATADDQAYPSVKNKYIQWTANSGAVLSALASDAGPKTYAGTTMVTDLPAADDHLFSGPAAVTPAAVRIFDSLSDLNAYNALLAQIAAHVVFLDKTQNYPLRWVDPHKHPSDY